MTSRVLRGSGLSSSASFEVLLGVILSGLYNGGTVDLTEIAQIGQFAENAFYGKPCGLMDQMACAHAGLVAIDFADPERPRLERLQIRFGSLGYQLMVVNTRGDHADLSGHYADIPREMKAAAAVLGREVLGDATLEELLRRAGDVRTAAGDRAFLRAYHFIQENRRVTEQLAALENKDYLRFLDLVNRSGSSSFEYLQNVYVPETPQIQEMAVGLAAAEALLEGRGAVRVHGGGFAGTILSLVPIDVVDRFIAGMDLLFGEGSVQPLAIRIQPAGPVTGPL
jgi:galactokinase